jgi:hypothetical protein
MGGSRVSFFHIFLAGMIPICLYIVPSAAIDVRTRAKSIWGCDYVLAGGCIGRMVLISSDLLVRIRHIYQSVGDYAILYYTTTL